MMNPSSAEFFEAKYRADPDPWNFATNPYDLCRYDAVLRTLGGRRYHCACEPGCSVGVLTAKLAELCDRVLAFDLSATAVEEARRRCAGFHHVELWQGGLAEFIPAGCDLLLLCELGYYLTIEDLRHTMLVATAHMTTGSTFVACHWLGQSVDHLLSGDQVHETLMTLPTLRHASGERHEGFRLDRWTVETNL